MKKVMEYLKRVIKEMEKHPELYNTNHCIDSYYLNY